jgi:hypothetical protein
MSDIHRAIENLQRQVNALREQVEAKAEPKFDGSTGVLTAYSREEAARIIQEMSPLSKVRIIDEFDEDGDPVLVETLESVWLHCDPPLCDINIIGLVAVLCAANNLPGVWRDHQGVWRYGAESYGRFTDMLEIVLERLREKGGA